MKKITKTQFTGRDFGKKTLRAYQIWVCIVSCFLVLLVIELGFFFWYFLQVGKRLETIPELGTDETAQKLETLEGRILKVEQVVETRTGTDL